MTLTHDPGWDLTVALINALDVSALTAIATGGVRDARPENPTDPCVVVQVRPAPIGTMGTNSALWDCDVEVHLWASYQGTRQIHEMAAKVTELLRHQRPTIDGWTLIMLTLDDQGRFAVADEEIGGKLVRHEVVPFRARLQRT